MENMKIIIEGSARHVHVSAGALEALFGNGYALHNKRELSQPGQYLTEEKLRLEGPKGAIDRVSILGPERPDTQIELSYTDARILGLVPPVRESGDIKGSAGLKLVGPAGELTLTEGAIVAKRHLHVIPEDAEKFGLSDKEIVMVRVEGPRALIFDEVVVRVSPKFQTRMHIDFDELNAAGLSGEELGTVIKK